MKQTQKKTGPASRTVAPTKNIKRSQQLSARTETGELNPDVEMGEKALEQELKQRTQELRRARQQLKQALAECRQVEKAREQQRLILDAIIDNASGPIFSVDCRYRYTSFNKEHAEVMKNLFGVEIEIGHNLLDYHTNPVDRLSAKKNIDRALRGEPVIIESYAGEETRSRRYFEIIHNPIRASNNKVVGVSMHARDITLRKHADAQIESLAKFPSENPNPVLRVNTEGVLLYANAASWLLLDEWQAEVGKPLPAFLKPLITAAQADKKLMDINCGERVFSFEISLIQDMDYVNLYGRDVTGHKLAEQALRDSEDRYKKLVKYAPAAIYEMDLQGTKFLSVNDVMCDILKYSREELLSIKPTDLMDETSKSLFRERIRRKLAGEEIDEAVEYRILRKDGVWIYTDINVGAITIADENSSRVVVVGHDITERKRTEQALRESEERYRQLVKYAPAGIYEVDFSTGRFIEVNDAMCQILGYEREELLAMTAFELLDDDGKALFSARIRQAQSSSQPTPTTEYRVRTKQGRFIWTLLNITFHWNAGRIVSATVIANEITERKLAEQAVLDSEARFHSVLDNSRDVIYRLNMQTGRYEYLSPSVKKLMGFSVEELMAQDVKTALAMVHPDDLPAVQAAYARAEETGEAEVVYRQMTKNGDYKWLSNRLSLTRDTSGQPLFRSGNLRDITERMQAEEALRQSEERFKLIASSTPDHILVQDRDLRYTFVVNPQMGLTKKDMLGKTDFDFLKKEDADILTRIKRKVLETGRAVHIQQPLISNDGTKQYFDGSYIPKRTADGKIDGLIGYFKNVTGIKRIEELLRASEERYRNLFNTMDEGFCIIQMIFDAQDQPVDYRFLEANAAFEKQTGLKDAQGKLMRELAPAHEAHWFEIYGKIALTGEPAHFINEARELGRWYEVYAYRVGAPEERRVAIIFNDITGRRLAEENLRRLNRTLRALSNTDQAMIHATGEQEYLDNVCKIIVEDCGHAMVWIGFKEQDEAKSVRPVASAGFEEGYLESLKITWADSKRGRGPTGTAIRTGKVAHCRNMLTDPKFAPWRAQALKRGYASSIVLPLLDGEQVFGAITIYAHEPEAFSEEEEKLLTELAGDLAYGIRALRIQAAHAQGEAALRQSEQRYRSLFNSMTEGFALHEIICDDGGRPCDFRFLDINPAFERLTGLKREDVIGKTHNQVLPDDSPKWVEAYGKVALTGEPVTFDNYSPALQKHYEVFAYRPAAGQFAVIFMDVTARKRMEQSLRESEQRFQLALRNAPVTVAIQDRDLIFRRAYNQRTVDPGAIIGKTDTDIFPAETAAQLIALKHKVLETETELHEQIWVTSGGQRLFLDLFIQPLRDAAGAVTGLGIATVDLTRMKLAEQSLTEARDELEERVWERTQELVAANEQLQNEIAERRRVESALLESESRYRTLFETSPDTVILTDLEDKVLFANQQAAKMHGFQQAQELVGMDVAALIAPEDRQYVHQSVLKTLELGSLREIEYQILMKDESRFPAELNVTAVRDDQGGPIGFLLDVRDITERKWAEESLRLANAYNRSLIEASLDPLVTITPEGKIGDVNQATENVTGYTRAELIGTDFHSYFSDPDKARAGYQKVFETGSVRDFHLEICNKDGSITPVLYNASIFRDETGKVLGVFAAARDITDRKQFETQLVQAEKHAVIGRMVGSITHEINNPLQTIKNCLYLIQQDVTADNPIQEPLEMATSETLRITNLVGHLRELYRPKTDSQKGTYEILDILEEAHSLLIPHLNNARVQWQPLTGLQRCYINCVRDQILEVFLNISMNAIEAMQSHGGTLFVNMNVSDDSAAIIFKDTGPGIPDELMPHLFEPFITTKGSGLGLGLSITYGIVQRHAGQIQVDSQPGQGASFTILLPLKPQPGGEEKIHHGNE